MELTKFTLFLHKLFQSKCWNLNPNANLIFPFFLPPSAEKKQIESEGIDKKVPNRNNLKTFSIVL